MLYVITFLYSTAISFLYSWGCYLRVPQHLLEVACIYIFCQIRNILETWLEETTYSSTALHWGFIELVFIGQSDNIWLPVQGCQQKHFGFFPLWPSNFSLCQSPVRRIWTLLTDQTKQQKFYLTDQTMLVCPSTVSVWQMTARSAQQRRRGAG